MVCLVSLLFVERARAASPSAFRPLSRAAFEACGITLDRVRAGSPTLGGFQVGSARVLGESRNVQFAPRI